jgi:hypothetical protein
VILDGQMEFRFFSDKTDHIMYFNEQQQENIMYAKSVFSQLTASITVNIMAPEMNAELIF